VSRLHRLLLISVALLCVFTVGAGLAVARLLPARLILWRIPRVAVRVFPLPGPVLSPVSGPFAVPGGPGRRSGASVGASGGRGARPTRAGLRAALSAALGSPVLGPHLGLDVADLATGRVLYSRAAGSAFTPASTAKLAVAVAALRALGPGARLRTTVVSGRTKSSITLVGGGDPTLAAGRPPAGDYPQPATLRSLAAATARALRARGRRAVRLGYDTSLYTGPDFGPGWTTSYVSTGNVSLITSLEVDQGRLSASGTPQDADVPGNFRPRSADPARQAARAFARFLAKDGIRVRGTPARTRAPVRGRAARRAVLATVASPPLAEIVQRMLTESDNVIAENLARQIAIAAGRPGSFAGAAAAETAVLRGLGVTGVHLVDGSGLSPLDRASPAALVRLIGLAAAQPRLRAVITGLPVAGFSGTLRPGGSVFAVIGRAGLGMIRAKTGNLSSVAGLAGLAYARDGRPLGFAVLADRLPAGQLPAAGADLAKMATLLAGCGCR
jgi:D-alanyl-D-alanine carboxypeptidase/D-alanyl-D-alanine-endopeptidase (penicillin-binding protein 4)